MSSVNITNKLNTLKSSLQKQEQIIIKLESNQFQSQTTITTSINEIESIHSEIEMNIKYLSNLILSDSQNKQLLKITNMKETLQERISIFKSNLTESKTKKNLLKRMTFDEKTGLTNKTKKEENDLNYVMNENDSLSRSFKISSSLNVKANENIVEIDNQNQSLVKSKERLEVIISHIPYINRLIYDVGYYKLREQVIIGVVTGICVYVLLSLIFD